MWDGIRHRCWWCYVRVYMRRKECGERDIGNKTKHIAMVHHTQFGFSLSHTRSSRRTAFICYLWVLFRFAYKFHNWSKLTCSSSHYNFYISHVYELLSRHNTSQCENFPSFYSYLIFRVRFFNLFFLDFLPKINLFTF